MKNELDLSIVIPLYKEDKTEIVQALNRLKKYLSTKNLSYEIIISQNGSDSFKYWDFHSSLVRLLHDKEKGLGIALKQGILEARGKYFYFNPSDIPFNFSDLENMLNGYQKFDLQIGSKLHPLSIYSICFRRKILTRAQHFVTKILFSELRILDVNGTLFGKTEKAQQILKKNEMDSSYFFSFQFVHLFRKNNFILREVPVTYRKQINKTNIYLLSDSLKYFRSLIYYKFTSNQ